MRRLGVVAGRRHQLVVRADAEQKLALLRIPARAVNRADRDELLAWLASKAAVDEHLADQLVPFLALGRTGSTFTCPRLSAHLETVVWLVRHFVAARITLEDGRPARVRIEPASPPG